MKGFPIDINKKVRCVKDSTMFRLEKGKTYTAISYTESIHNSFYMILADGKKKGWITTDIFIEVKEWRDMRINEIIENI